MYCKCSALTLCVGSVASMQTGNCTIALPLEPYFILILKLPLSQALCQCCEEVSLAWKAHNRALSADVCMRLTHDERASYLVLIFLQCSLSHCHITLQCMDKLQEPQIAHQLTLESLSHIIALISGIDMVFAQLPLCHSRMVPVNNQAHQLH